MENKKFNVWKFDVTAMIYVKYQPTASFTMSIFIDCVTGKDKLLERIGNAVEHMTAKAVHEAQIFVTRFAGEQTLIDKTSKVTILHKISYVEHKELRDRVGFEKVKPKMIHLPGQGGKPN